MRERLLNKKTALIAVGILLALALFIAAMILLAPKAGNDSAISSEETSSIESEPSSSSPSSSEPASSVPPSSAPPPEFKITSHRATDVTVLEPFTVFSGISDPAEPLLLNGEEITRDDKGAFSAEYDLTPGKNTFKFSHKGKEYTYIVRYRFDIIKSITPSGDMKFESGSTFAVTVNARVGSVVSATFNGQTIFLSRNDTQGGDEEAATSDTFVNFMGSFTLPSGNKTDLKLGVVQISATHSGNTATAKTGNITCKKVELPVIGEIVAFSAETFDGDKTDDASRPTNNYLPAGTVDYVVGRAYNGSKEYLLLRCGRRVYVDKKMVPTGETVVVAREYEGTLPDKNHISIASFETKERQTVLTLNTDWKAPFILDILPQAYQNPSKQDYRISSFTGEYVEITFCYADGIEGEIIVDENNPLFSSAEIKAEGEKKILRLNFKEKGAFYGWNAYYNSENQLVFEFLNPAKITVSNNEYGADLSGAVILIDIGHGGSDFGAPGIGNTYFEEERNLYLGFKLKAELESMGATVIMNRESDSTIKADDRCEQLKRLKPDLCIAIHHDSNASSKPNGFGMYYSTPFSHLATKFIYDRTKEANIYTPAADGYRDKLDWHYYFVARMSDCPVVLTENGFMSSPIDRDCIVSEQSNIEKAKAIAMGVADYFLEINSLKRGDIPETSEPTTGTSSEETSSQAPAEGESSDAVSG